MKIVLARSAGFCFGVRSAVDKISLSLHLHKRIQIDGDLIHNPETIGVLSGRGLSKVGTFNGADPVAVRTHGTTSEKLREIHLLASTTYNLTCPKVSRIQGIIRKYSRDNFYILLVGDAQHPEVVSLKSYAESGITIIRSADQIPDLPSGSRTVLISQTTIDHALFETLREQVLLRYPDCVVFDTICDSTGNKQAELREALDAGADTVVVIGGRHSANTRSLASIAENRGVRTIHIETADECRKEDFADSRSVFVTAGASTPGWAIRDTLDRLRDISSPLLRAASHLLYSVHCLFLPDMAVCACAAAALSSGTSRVYAAAGAMLLPVLSLAAERMVLPFTLYSEKKRFTFYTRPCRFLTSGPFAETSHQLFQPHQNLSAAFRAAAGLSVPAVFLLCGGISLTSVVSAVILCALASAPSLAREIRSADTDLVTGKRSALPSRRKLRNALLILLSAASAAAGIFIAGTAPSVRTGVIAALALTPAYETAVSLGKTCCGNAQLRAAELLRLAAAVAVLL